MADIVKEKPDFFKGVKAEYNKIIWPNKDDLIKQTIAVITVSLILGLLIVSMDWLIRNGLEFLQQIMNNWVK
jgi:preprotein translocase, secE subunit